MEPNNNIILRYGMICVYVIPTVIKTGLNLSLSLSLSPNMTD